MQTPKPLAELYCLWDALKDIPTVFDGEEVDTLEEPFLHFPVGTHREDVWRWFEQQNPLFIVGEVMQGVRADVQPLSSADRLLYLARNLKSPQEVFGYAISLSAVYQETGDDDHDCFYFQNDGSAAIVNRNTLQVEVVDSASKS